MSSTVFPYKWSPRDYQVPFLQDMTGHKGNPKSAKKKAIVVMGRQMGKDTTCGIFMFKQALQVPGNYFYIFPYSTMARRAFWEKVDPLTGLKLIDQIPQSAISRIVLQEMLIELNNNSTIRLIGLDQNPDAARGISPTGVVVSEAAYVDPAVLSAIEPAVAMNNAWVVYNSTPNGLNHFHKMYKHAMSRNDWHVTFAQCYDPDGYGYHPIEGIDNNYFKELLDSGLMSQEDIEREYACSWSVELKGSYYASHINKAVQEGRIGMYPHNPNYSVNTYWDLGWTDDTVCWFAQNIRGKTVFIDYFEGTQMDVSDLVNMLSTKGYKYGNHVLPWDAAGGRAQTGKSTAELFTTVLCDMGVSGYVDVMPQMKRQAGIDAVRRRFAAYCFNEPTTRIGIDKLELYHRQFDKRTKEFRADPVHDSNSHAADALRMEAMSEDLVPDPFYDNEGLGPTTINIGLYDDEV